MSIIKMIGKIAGSNVIQKVENEITKKQNREQTSKYCTYIRSNITRICKSISCLRAETIDLIGQFTRMQSTRISFREKTTLKNLKENTYTNLRYLYLTRDFFTALSKNASGLALQNEELMLVIKFAPFFDGVPVLEFNDSDEDDSIFGQLREIRSAFSPQKKDANHFNFYEYLYRYRDYIEKCIIPDTDSAIESFQNAMSALDLQYSSDKASAEIPVSTEICNEIECQNCHAKLKINTRFCPECGNKIEIKKATFCTQCGETIAENAKFCANCGAKI